MEIVGLLLALIVGLSLGLLGGGGSILTVPIFVYVLGYEPAQAIAASLPVIGATSLIGAIGHWRNGNVNGRAAVSFGAAAMAGAYLGAGLAVFLSGTVQLLLLAIVMLAAALSMLRQAPPVSTPVGEAALSPVITVAVGLGIGMLTGVVGIGGGFLIVPALVVFARLSMKHAIGTSLVVIALNSAAGAAGYLTRVSIPWTQTALFTLVAVAGALVGVRLVRFVSQAALRRAFAGLLFLIGTLMVIRNSVALSPRPASRRAADSVLPQPSHE